MKIIAIDPGASGGIAAQSARITEAYAMPQTPGDIVSLLMSFSASGYRTIYLEKVGGYVGGKGAPGSAMFNFGHGVGVIEGSAMALGFRIIEVTPQKWQKHFSLGKASECASKTEWKNKLKAEAQRRFPACDVTLKTADALLILDYAVKQEVEA